MYMSTIIKNNNHRMPVTMAVRPTQLNRDNANRDFKIRYGKVLVRRQIVKITSGEVMTRVPVRLSRRSLAFYYGKVVSRTLHYVSISLLFPSHLNAFFTA